jgi:nitrite reductase (NO-forming)
MSVTLDRPPSPRPPAIAPRPPRKQRWLERYQSHLLIGGLSVMVTAIGMSPLVLGSMSRSSVTLAPVAPTNPSSQVAITATEFKFNPNNIQVPVGGKVAFTLDNNGVVEHDITIPSAGVTLSAKAGQSASGEIAFNKPAALEFFCSIPGHKDAGMKGSLTVVDPTAAPPLVQPVPVQPGMAGMNTVSAPGMQPLPADLKPLQAPHIAPPIERTEPAYVKFDLTTEKVTAKLADGVAYDYWTFNGTVPGPMLRVREGDTVEIDLRNAADAGVTHSIDLHAVTGPGGGAKVMQIPPGEDGSFKFKALNPGVYVYHCATLMVAHHIASGMYGLIVVEPGTGLAKVDHEYYLMQGDFYLQGQRGDTGLRAFDLNKMLDEQPDYGSSTAASAH